MKLKRLELFGFKSFADRTVIEFDNGITGVVGPNGSGKSNISDAVRWVLGEQSARSLRGGRMEDIIFNGTEKRRPLAYSEVTLVLDNEDAMLSVDFTEVSVTRRVYRSGDSEYYINRAACRLRDVIDLFRDSGIGREGYSIIGQGKVDEVLSNKPEDRRNVFHEAAGIMKYRTRKEEAQKNLANTQANLDRINDIMQVMEGRIGPLKQQSENARRYLTLAEQLKGLEINRFLMDYERMDAESRQSGEQLAAMDAVLDQQADDLEARQNAIAEGNERLAGLETDWTAAEEKTNSLQNDLTNLAAEREIRKERLAHLAEEHDRLEEARDRALEKAKDLRGEAEEQRALRAQSDGARADFKRRLAEEEAHLADMDAEIAEGEEALEREKQQTLDTMGKLGDAHSAVSRMEGQRRVVMERLEQLKQQIVDSAEHAKTARFSTAALQDELAAMEKSAEADSTQMEELDARRRDTAEKLENLNKTLGSLREQQQELRTRLAMLQNMKRDYEGYNNTVRALLKDAAKDDELGRCVDAVVAEVVRVPKEYILAVETALGAAGQNIITADEQAAKRLIGHLRTHQYGRATFLPLTTIRGRLLTQQERSETALDGLCGVASELVSFDEKYREVVNNLLGRTLIARDLDAAIAISRACHASLRVVTLAGDVMNPGGSMTGGSVRSRVTSILGRDQEIERTEEQQKKLASQMANVQASVEKGRTIALQLEGERGLLQRQTHAADVEIARKKEQLEKAVTNADRLDRETTALTDEQTRLTSELEHMAESIRSWEAEGSSLETDNKAAMKAMADHQRQLNILREERDEVMDHLGMLRATEAADARDLAAMDQRIERILRDAAEREADAHTQEDLLTDNERRRLELAGGEASDAQRREALEAAIRDAKDGAQQLLQAREELRETLNRQSLELQDAREENMEARQRRFEQESRAERVRRDLETLQNRIWDSYELTYANALPLKDESLMTPEAQKETDKLRRQIRGLGPINVAAIEEYAQVSAEYEEYLTQSTDLNKAKERLEEMISQMSSEMERIYRDAFDKLNVYFGETFKALFGGGQAFLKLEDESDILESGVEMHVQPPGKKLQLLTLLSGGERALTAIALLFAMLRLKPTPFCILDEIEAALDEPNIAHFTDYVANYARSTQFVIITHRKSTMECCDTLYGVTMQEKGISKMLRVRMSDIIEETAE